jgi:hypothetical protein
MSGPAPPLLAERGASYRGYVKKYAGRRKARLMLGYTDFMARHGGWRVEGARMASARVVELYLRPPAIAPSGPGGETAA